MSPSSDTSFTAFSPSTGLPSASGSATTPALSANPRARQKPTLSISSDSTARYWLNATQGCQCPWGFRVEWSPCNLLRMSCDSAVDRIKTVVASPENVSAVSGFPFEVAIDSSAFSMAISTPSFVKRHAVANKLQTRALLIAVNLVAGLSIFFFGYDQGK